MKRSLRTELSLSLFLIAFVLLISCVISMLEYSRMNSYVSDFIADNVRSVNMAQKLSESVSEYNLEILAVIGDDSMDFIPYFDGESFTNICDSLRAAMSGFSRGDKADSVKQVYSNYMETASELGPVLLSDFIDSRTWYFETLQPQFKALVASIDDLSAEIYQELSRNSVSYEEGFYRSIIPTVVAIGIGILLVLMLLFYVLSYIVSPIEKMIEHISGARAIGKKYNLDVDGEPQIRQLNTLIKELSSENQNLRKRVAAMRVSAKVEAKKQESTEA